MLRRLPTGIVAAVIVTSLVSVSSATSTSTAGIDVTAQEVTFAFEAVDQSFGVRRVDVVASAWWKPEAPATEGAIIIQDLTEGSTQRIPFRVIREPHSFESHRSWFAAYQGHRYAITATWRVYHVDAFDPLDGTANAPYVGFTAPKLEPAPRISEALKQQFKAKADSDYARCGRLAIATLIFPPGAAVMSAACASALRWNGLSRDPVDLNFRTIAPPVIPTPPRISAGQGLEPHAAAAVNALLVVQARQIGISRAILTALDRSQGAHVKKQTAWERKQMLAAGKYAAQLSRAVRDEMKLRPTVSAAVVDSALGGASVSAKEADGFAEFVVRKGLPPMFAPGLTRLDLTNAERKEVRAQLLVRDPGFFYTGAPFEGFSRPEAIASLRQLAAGLVAFSKKAARDPLNTAR